LRGADEQALRAGVAVDDRRRAAAKREPIGPLGDGKARIVGDVLPERQRAVDLIVGQRAEGVALRDEAAGLAVETAAVLLGPPVAQVTLAIEAAALVVEGVTDLVPDHRADRTIIGGVVRPGVEERLLQDAGRKQRLGL
jgi:hypothetical protein